jgi:nucleoside-diphosphate-sugar epimerase
MSSTLDAVVIGYGPVGATVTAQLLEAGRRVRVVTRSGSGPAEADRVQADMLDPAAAATAIGDAGTVFVAFQAPYRTRSWRSLLPRMEASVTGHAARSGAAVAFVESLYAFDAATTSITENSPLHPQSRKGAVRRDLIQARARSGANVVSVVSGDFYGRLVAPILRGRTLHPIGDPDQPHAFTYVPDLARAMIAAAALGRTGHELVLAPGAGSVTMRQLAELTARAAGVELPRLAPMTPAALRILGVGLPILRELADVAHQFTRPFEVDSRAGEARLHLTATPWPVAAQDTVGWWRSAR